MEITEKQVAEFCDNYCKYLASCAEGIKRMPDKARFFHQAQTIMCENCPFSKVMHKGIHNEK